jgi:hypothetical protein
VLGDTTRLPARQKPRALGRGVEQDVWSDAVIAPKSSSVKDQLAAPEAIVVMSYP